MGVVSVELSEVLLYFWITDGSSINQLAFPLPNTGFFKKFLIVLITRSAIEGTLSVNLGNFDFFYF